MQQQARQTGDVLTPDFSAGTLRFHASGPPTPSHIWAFGGGKGGSGKSFCAASCGLYLARRHRSVLMVDLDLGGANLHTCLGLDTPGKSLSEYFMRGGKDLEEVIVSTPFENLFLISGAQDVLGATSIKYFSKTKFLRALTNLPFDHLILDLGAGTHLNTLDFFLHAHQRVLVSVPEPSAIENTYRFAKSAVLRGLRLATQHKQIRELLQEHMNTPGPLGRLEPLHFFKEIEAIDRRECAALRTAASEFRPWLLLNQVRDEDDRRLGPEMAQACRLHLGIEVPFLAGLHYDEGVWRAARERRPYLEAYPNSELTEQICHTAERLRQRGQLSLDL